jgi:chromosome segregation ATPase
MVVCLFDRVWLMRAFTVLSPPLGYSRLSFPVCSTKHATHRLHRQAAELSVAKQTLESAEAQRRDLQSQLSTLNTKLDAVKGQELVALAKLAGCTEERDRLSTQLQTCTANLEHSKAEVAKLQHDIDTAARRAAVLTQQIVVLTDDLQRSKDETTEVKRVLVDKESVLSETRESALKNRDGMEKLAAVCDAQRGSWLLVRVHIACVDSISDG